MSSLFLPSHVEPLEPNEKGKLPKAEIVPVSSISHVADIGGSSSGSQVSLLRQKKTTCMNDNGKELMMALIILSVSVS